LTGHSGGHIITLGMLRLLTFGGLALERRDGMPAPRLRPQRLAILAVLAAAGERGVSRERMSALLWPDADEERARHSLRQALYSLRQEAGAEVVQSSTVLSLDRDALSSDVGDFRAALVAGDRARAAALANGPFLEGFYLSDAPEFERWVEEQRTSLAADATRVLVALTKQAESAGDRDAALELWSRLSVIDPLSGRFALGYLKALAAHGDRAAALAFARAHESLVRRELEADADPEIHRLEAELRAMPSPAVVRIAPAQPTHQLAVVSSQLLEPLSEPKPPIVSATPQPSPRLRIAVQAAIGVFAILGVLTADRWLPSRRVASGANRATFAVGMIREDGVPDTLRIGGVLTDMLATNLARVAGLSVLANTRLFELMRPGQDTLAGGYYDAARRAGATEILQGRLLPGPRWSLAMEIQRVDLATGIVKAAYRVSASDRYALVDSMTAAVAHDLHFASPTGSVSDATTDSPIAYRLYEEGLRAYYQYDDAAARRLMQAALEEDSTFAMAAYYEAVLVPDNAPEMPARARALRLAARAPESERLRIAAELLMLNMEPGAVAVAESLTTKYPTDPRGFELLSRALEFRGDRLDAVTAIERAIALDSASEPIERQRCRLCGDYMHLAEIYLWWDSLSAAERTAQRYLRVRPKNHGSWDLLFRSAAARGDTNAAHVYARRFHAANPMETSPIYIARRDILAEDYERATRALQPFLTSPRPTEVGDARWLLSIAFRNQGRLQEALRLSRLAPNEDLGPAMAALDEGNPRIALAVFRNAANADESALPLGLQGRYRAWYNTLFGMALAASGDNFAVRRLADTVEYWGNKSLYGRDRRAHHYLRGMVFAAEGHDAEAAVELRDAIHSPTHGFTRVNYELGKTLMRLNRPADVEPVVRAALHGDIDGSNLYTTRTELHELLAQAFDRQGKRDSAAVHFRAVVRAWEHADPMFLPRRDRARAWLAANPSSPSSATRRGH
jgi:DNA-binding SARP family transcriptional activator/predicted Zn-dependent protease